MAGKDYTKYPEGLELLASELDLPMTDKAQREAFVYMLMDGVLKS